MDVSIGDKQFSAHALRAAVLGEVHARPFTPLESPRRILHFAFDTAGERAKGDRAAFTNFCRARGLEPLKDGAKQHRVLLGGATLRWEQHSEFTTYTWELPSDGKTPFYPAAATLAEPMAALPQQLDEKIARLKADLANPIAIGFGISTAAHVRALRGKADGIVVGSALVKTIAENANDPAEAAGSKTRELLA